MRGEEMRTDILERKAEIENGYKRAVESIYDSTT